MNNNHDTGTNSIEESSESSEFNKSLSLISQKFKSTASEECYQEERHKAGTLTFK